MRSVCQSTEYAQRAPPPPPDASLIDTFFADLSSLQNKKPMGIKF